MANESPPDSETKKFDTKNSAFMQQSLKAWRPYLTSLHTAIVFAVFTGLSLLFAIMSQTGNSDIFTYEVRYDDICPVGTSRTFTFTVPKELTGGLFVFYKLTSFYQSNFMFLSSKSWPQIEGEHPDSDTLSKCDPLRQFNGSTLAPCGTFPVSLFNDTFTFLGSFPSVTRTGISVPSYSKFYKPLNSQYVSTAGDWLSNRPDFPGGQTNERFTNWMHISAFPTFQKVWGKTESDKIPPGDYSVEIQCNFPVQSFDGQKTLIVSEVGWTGGKNGFMGAFFWVLFVLSALLAVAYFAMHVVPMMQLYRQTSVNHPLA
jgi:hypothetical protein